MDYKLTAKETAVLMEVQPETLYTYMTTKRQMHLAPPFKRYSHNNRPYFMLSQVLEFMGLDEEAAEAVKGRVSKWQS